MPDNNAAYFEALHDGRLHQPVTARQSCDKCGGLGYLSTGGQFGEAGFGKMIDCPCRAGEVSARLQASCGLTDIEKRITLATVALRPGSDTERMVKALQDFISHPSGIVTITGTCGNAKSVALVAVVNACIAAGLPAIYVTYRALLDDIRQSYKTDTAHQRLEQYMNVRVLCIDEFGTSVKHTEWVQEAERALIDHRYRFGLAGQLGTVLVTNDALSLFADHISSRLSDGRNSIIANNDPDLRPLMAGQRRTK